MGRSMTSRVSTVSGFVANGHQTVHHVSCAPLKFRTVGLPQYGFKLELGGGLRRIATYTPPKSWRSRKGAGWFPSQDAEAPNL